MKSLLTLNNIIKLFAYMDIFLGIILISPLSGNIVKFMHSVFTQQEHLIDEYHMFLMALLGITIILWGVIRINHTEQWQAKYDCIARCFVLILMGYYCFHGLSFMFFFLATESLGLLQLLFYFKEAK
ncbi:MAG: hypothetical protein MK207_03435 [Saprospiraceae bacterium]|nr:hypothetical protein [Saprospiraceae bacterium]